MKIRKVSLLLAFATLPSVSYAVDFNWNGSVDSDWANGANWTPAGPPGGGAGNHAIINNGGTASLSAASDALQDTIIASGAGTSGTLNHSAGVLNNSAGWVFIGRNGGNGTYNMTGSSGLTTGELQIGGQRDAAVGSQVGTVGKFTMDTTGTVALTGAMWIGSRGGSGSATITNGTLTTTEIRVGDNEGAVSAGTGSLTINGGTITSANQFQVGRHGAVGTVNQSAGTVNVNAGWFGIANDNAGSAGSSYTLSGGALNLNNAVNAEVGADTQGSFNLSGTGALSANQLFVGHRANGNGTFTMTGGTLTVRAGESRVGNAANSTGLFNMSGGTFNANSTFQVGASGNGTMNISGGTVNNSGWLAVGRFTGGTGNLNVSAGQILHTNNGASMLIGEQGTGTVTLSGTGLISINSTLGVRVGHTATGNGTLNLDGGTFEANFFQKTDAGSQAKINFNGGKVKALASSSDYFLGFAAANLEVKAGGAVIDTNGNDITITQALAGAGGLSKLSAGRLTLTGVNTYAGTSTVDGGTLQVDGSTTGSVVTNTGAVLTGIGSVGGNVTVTGGTLSPGQNGGADAGTLSVLGSVTLDSSSTLMLTINDDAPGGFDVINNTGSFSAGGAMLTGTFSDTTFTMALDAASLATATRYKFVTGAVDGTTFGNATPLSAADLAVLGLSSGDEVTISGQRFLLEKGSWALVPIPEPSAALLALTGLALLRRRRA